MKGLWGLLRRPGRNGCPLLGDLGEHRADGRSLPLPHQDMQRSRHLGVQFQGDLVGLQFAQEILLGHTGTILPVPFGKGHFMNRFTDFRDLDLHGNSFDCKSGQTIQV
jgi:hypothetical protein